MNAESIDLAIIGGTGLYRLAGLQEPRAASLPTPYGHASAPARVGTLFGKQVAFLARHGESHGLPPHKINYRANLHMLKALGAQRVLAINTVGGITDAFAPRVLGLPDQIIDYTWGRISTFSEEAGSEVKHAEFAEPYSAALRRQVQAAAESINLPVVAQGCYGATQGPRLETRAEIARLRRDGCDVVGMTGMPEAALARELDLDYACLVIIANWAAGCDPAGDAGLVITMDEVLANVDAVSAQLPPLLEALLARL